MKENKNKTSITKTEWLYGVEPSHFDGMEFFRAIEERLRLARKELFREVRYGANRPDRVRDIQDAMDWCLHIMGEKEAQ